MPLCVGMVSFAWPARADPIPISSLSWIDLYGNTGAVKWKSRSQWLWLPQKEAPGDSFVLRTTVEIPSDVELVKIKSDKFLQVISEPEHHRLIFDLKSAKGSAAIRYNTEKEKGLELNAVVVNIAEKPEFFLHGVCQTLGVDIRAKDEGPRPDELKDPAFISAKCEQLEPDVPRSQALDLTLFRSTDMEWTLAPESDGVLLSSGPDWVKYRFHAPHEDIATLLTLKLRNPETRTSSTYLVTQANHADNSRWQFSGSLGITYMTYSEQDAVNVSFGESALTAKVSVGYVLIPRKLDVAANAFINAVPLSISSSVDPMRIYGINERISYHLPIQQSGVDYALMAGWYFWGMIVPDESYGVVNLGGPQILFRAGFTPKSVHPFGIYLKYAAIQDTPTDFTFSNYEAAIGANYQLSENSSARPYQLTLDIAWDTYQDPDRSLHLFSVSLGLSKRIF